MDRIDMVNDRGVGISCSNKIQTIISLINKLYVFNSNPGIKRTYLLLAIL